MRKTFAIACAILASAVLRAQDASSVAMPQSVVPRDVRTLSLGLVSASGDPAFRLLGDGRLDASLSWYAWAPKGAAANDINADLFMRFGDRLGVSAQIGYDSGAAYDIYDADGIKGDSYNPSDMMIKLGASYRFLPMLCASVSARYLSSALAPSNSYSAFAADAFVAATFGSTRVVAGVTNIGTSVTGADGVAYPLPAAASLAGSCKLSFAGVHAVDAYAQADYFFRGGLRAGAGVEYGYNGLAFVRLGYSYGGKSPVPSCLTLGLGINYYNFTIDASYLVGNSSITNTLGISLGYRF